MTPKMNDLLRLQPRAALILDAPAPDWVAPSLAGIPWVVVRRGEIRNGVIPVGVRGLARAERFKALVSLSGVAYRVSPGDLALRSDRVLMKTANGVRLIADSWQEAA